MWTYKKAATGGYDIFQNGVWEGWTAGTAQDAKETIRQWKQEWES
jgi:hypothetical protein